MALRSCNWLICQTYFHIYFFEIIILFFFIGDISSMGEIILHVLNIKLSDYFFERRDQYKEWAHS